MTLNASSAPVFVNGLADLDPPPSVALVVTGTWSTPPSIGEVEGILMAEGRAVHRIWRIEVGQDSAVVHVHHDDVASCVGLIEYRGEQYTISVLNANSYPPMAMAPADVEAMRPESVSAPPPELLQPSRKRTKMEVPPAAVTPLPPPPMLLSDALGDNEPLEPEEALALAAAAAAAEAKAEAKREEEKQRRLYRVGLSYRCGRCGKPKKGHVCDVPDEGDGSGDNGPISQQASSPTILATTVRKGTPPALLGSPLHASVTGMGSPEVKVSGEASTIFKDMVAALGENSATLAQLSPTAVAVVSPSSVPPPQLSTGISPLAQSAIATGQVSESAAPVAVLPATAVPPQAHEPQLSEMDLMLADLAFAARPPPVMTPDEGAEPVANSLGSLSPSNFSPGTMIQQLITTPGHAGWSAAQLAEMSGAPQIASAVRRNPVVAQPSA